MKIFNLLIAIVVCFGTIILSSSCKGEDEIEPLGLCHNPIRLSQNEVSLDANGGTANLTTKEKGWIISGISLDGEHINYAKSITLMDKNNYTIDYKPFTIEVKEGNKINVTLKENNTSKVRTLGFGLQNGNCFTSAVITQKAK